MKNKINKGFLLSLFSLLAITSCGGPSNGSISIESKPDESGKIESEYSSSENINSKEPEKSEEVSSEVEKEESSEEIILPEENSPKLMEHVVEVANNVDKTPTFMTELKQNKKQRRSYKDITDSSNHENYEIYLGMNGLTGSSMTSVVGANNFVEQMKQTKDEIITSVTCLDKWVEIYTEIPTRAKITYNQIYDKVDLEFLSNDESYITYYHINSSYDNKGNIVIDGYYYRYDKNTSMSYVYTLSYQENNYFFVQTCHNNTFIDDAITIIRSDLTKEVPITTSLEYSYIDQGDRYNFFIEKKVFQEMVEDDPGLAFFLSYQYPELIEGHPLNPIEGQSDYEILSHHYNSGVEISDSHKIINDSNGHYVSQIQLNEHSGSMYINTNPYALNGIKSILDYGDYIDVEFEDLTLSTYNNENYDASHSSYETEDYVFVLACRMNFMNTPDIHFTINPKQGCSKTYANILKEGLEHFGLGIKDEIAQHSFENIDDMRDELSKHNYGGISADEYLKASEIYQIYENNIKKSFTHEEIIAKSLEESVSREEQDFDEKMFELYGCSISGNVSFVVENTKIDLSEVTATIGQSELLIKGKKYYLVSELLVDGHSYSLDSKEVIFEGLDTNVSLGKYDIPEDLLFGEYTLITYVINEEGQRISSLYNPKSIVDTDVVIEKDDLLIRVKLEDTFNMYVQETYTLSSEISYDQKTDEFDLSNLNVSLMDQYIILQDEKISLNLYYRDSIDSEYTLLLTSSDKYGEMGVNLVVDGEFETPATIEEGNFKLELVITSNDVNIYSYETEEVQFNITLDETPKDEEVGENPEEDEVNKVPSEDSNDEESNGDIEEELPKEELD